MNLTYTGGAMMSDRMERESRSWGPISGGMAQNAEREARRILGQNANTFDTDCGSVVDLVGILLEEPLAPYRWREALAASAEALAAFVGEGE